MKSNTQNIFVFLLIQCILVPVDGNFNFGGAFLDPFREPSAAPVAPPVTSAPITASPVTKAPATSAPATTAPVTSSPATSSPVTSKPATSAPATSAPVTSAPATSAPATPSPVAPAPVTSSPVTSSPQTSAPATSSPVTSSPQTSAPATSSPMTLSPQTSAPATSSPVTSSPVTPAPVTSSPVTAAPVVDSRATSPPRSSSHQFLWGSVVEGCDFATPVAFLNCGNGGWIQVTSNENSECENLSLDYLKCTAIPNGLEDAIVNFKCSGFTSEHLTASARIFRSAATKCDKEYSQVVDGSQTTTVVGGNAVAFGTLGRYCLNNENTMELVNKYPCIKGMEGEDGDVTFCAAGDMCTDEQTCGILCSGAPPVCDLEVDSLEMANSADLATCSRVDNTVAISASAISQSILASYYTVEWTFSDQLLDCGWSVPDITLTCQDEGTIRLEESYSFCTVSDDSITCTNPDPMSQKERVTIRMGVWCSGDRSEQLTLSAICPSANDSFSHCSRNGIAVQGIKVARACGNFASPDFEFITDPAFCSDSAIFHEPSGLCFSGYKCQPPATSCSPVVAAVDVTTDTASVRNCIYAI